jgi:iron complex outermembrane receptor protein
MMLRPGRIVLAAMLGALPVAVPAQDLPSTQDPARTGQDLQRLSIEELADIDVTSVSRRHDRLSDTAAVSVLQAEDLRRPGYTMLAEAMRLSDALDVVRVFTAGGPQYAFRRGAYLRSAWRV